MEEGKNRNLVEKKLKEAMRKDRARIQIGEISSFGLLELSRQRLRPSVIENSSELCPQCGGSGRIQSIEVSAIQILRSIEEESNANDIECIKISAHSDLILHILNKKRTELNEIESSYKISIDFINDNSIIPPQKKLEIIRNKLINDQELKDTETKTKTNSTSDHEDENENENKKGKRLSRRKKKVPRQDRNIVKTTFEEKNKVQDISEDVQKKKPRTKTKKSIVKKPKVKTKDKLKDTETNIIEKEKTNEIETKKVNTEVREIKSSSPIEVTQIEENSSSKKPKKKGWWS